MSLKFKAVSALSWSLADKLINQLGYLAVTVYLARLIGPESFGLIGMLAIFTLLADSVVSNGFSNALVQRSQQLTEDDACTVFWVNLGWGTLIYAVLFVAAPWIAQFYRQPELIGVARVLFLVIIINAFSVVARAKLTIAVDFKSQAIANTSATVLSSALAALLAQRGYGYWALIWLMVSKAVIASLGVWWFCRWLPRWRLSRASFTTLFGFGSKLMLAGSITTVVDNLYAPLIGYFYNVSQVGFFTQAANLSNYLSGFISSSLQGVSYPIMTSIKDEHERLVSIFKQMISVSMLVCLPLLSGFAAVANDVVLLLLGDAWRPTIPILIALSIARTVTPVSSINANMVNVVGRSDLFLKVSLSKIPIAITALFLALPYGVEGLAWAMVCSSFIAFFINAWYPGKIFGFGGIAQLGVARPYIAASAIMFTVVYFLPWGTSFVGLAGKIIFGTFVYVAMVWVMGDKFVRQLMQWVPLGIKALRAFVLSR
ncbi:Lipopolysaccharide biosynthesis protein WzxC [Sterolibacterium denitrificans]|uniref:Lipopolysaccharide biosynthesis protein WzxC n=1 Tax=Sterolibacterium denitrificans TaxID=157592 RepID=A0A7Z7HQ07_9PROT|nr:lipopolysaccharide biosynthesis protein [Sterolibacterium denitrificans]SMB22929.1 Lipopolysaccharide biosynthesis protein WzxC [Sterolibacterium denitrificans]